MTLQSIMTRKVKRRIIFFLMIVCLAACSGASSALGEVITVMAANLSSGDNQAYEMAGIRIFQGLSPDIILIQEFNYNSGSLRDFVDLAFDESYDYFVEPGDENIPNGVISRYPILASGQWTDSYVTDRDYAWAIIDIPGNLDLQVVSVHLKSGEATTRNEQATQLKSYIQTNFNPNHYIVVGGDLNTTTRTEAAIATFNSFLSPTNHIPDDQNGNSNTSEPRTRPYDWVMPNDLLDSMHAPLIIDSSEYAEGLVFDSHVYTPLSEVAPIQYGDSHVNGMQHMAVMRAFQISASAPTPTPTSASSPSPTPTSYNSPVPSMTPTPNASQTQGPSPTPTTSQNPTTTPVFVNIDIHLNREVYHANDAFRLSLKIQNDGVERHPAQFVILSVAGLCFFHPSWNQTLDYSVIDLQPFDIKDQTLLEFLWPPGSGSGQGLIFYSALTHPSDYSLMSNIDSAEFRYE